jgi:capsular polysaccharide transport system permease protein
MTMITDQSAERRPVVRASFLDLIKVQWQILVAIMLRDVRTRFVGNHFGMIISICWPLTHILVLLAINTGMGRLAPYGDSAALWFATGVIPFMAFNYMARFIILGILINRNMLTLPRIKILDIVFARAIVEVLSAGLIVLIMMLIFWVGGIDFAPINPIQALFALAAMMLLGLGIGTINAIIAAAIPIWGTVFVLFQIVMWIVSGVFFVPSALPEVVQYPLSFNPALHGIEWMRSAYYDGYGDRLLDKGYLLGFGAVSFALGLVIERLMRGRLLQT